MLVSPSILAADFSNLKNEITKIQNAGADMAHMDVMDGNFVPNISFGVPVIKSLRKVSDLVFDVHLMIKDPLKYVKVFADCGSDMITFHAEAGSDILKTAEKIKSLGKKTGLSIKPGTPADEIFPFLKYVDLVLIMTVEPGFGGQKFMEDQMEKTKQIKEANPNVLISVDGGINPNTIKTVRKYPVDICVAGTCVFESKNIKNTIKALK